MMRIYLVTIFIFLAFNCFSQENRNSNVLELNTKITGLTGSTSDLGEQEKAFSFGLFFLGTHKVSNTTGVSFGIGYEFSNLHYKDYSITIGSDIDPTTGADYRKTYIAKKIKRHYAAFPARISFNLGEKRKHQLFLGAGLFIPIPNSQKKSGELYSQSDPSSNGTHDNYTQKEAPSFVNAQIGYNYNINEHFYLGIKFEYNIINFDYLNSYLKTTNVAQLSSPAYITNLGLTLGYEL